MRTNDTRVKCPRNLVFHDIIVMNSDKELILQQQLGGATASISRYRSV